MISKTQIKNEQRMRRHGRVRARISGTSERPRLAVYKSNTRLSAQLIDDIAGVTLASVSTAQMKGSPEERLAAAALDIAKQAKDKGISKVVFDRGGFQYIGIIKKFADATREAGLAF